IRRADDGAAIDCIGKQANQMVASSEQPSQSVRTSNDNLPKRVETRMTKTEARVSVHDARIAKLEEQMQHLQQ
ncbi:unnamed protein product, partial [Prorocentrum cordatum]